MAYINQIRRFHIRAKHYDLTFDGIVVAYEKGRYAPFKVEYLTDYRGHRDFPEDVRLILRARYCEIQRYIGEAQPSLSHVMERESKHIKRLYENHLTMYGSRSTKRALEIARSAATNVIHTQAHRLHWYRHDGVYKRTVEVPRTGHIEI